MCCPQQPSWCEDSTSKIRARCMTKGLARWGRLRRGRTGTGTRTRTRTRCCSTLPRRLRRRGEGEELLLLLARLLLLSAQRLLLLQLLDAPLVEVDAQVDRLGAAHGHHLVRAAHAQKVSDRRSRVRRHGQGAGAWGGGRGSSALYRHTARKTARPPTNPRQERRAHRQWPFFLLYMASWLFRSTPQPRGHGTVPPAAGGRPRPRPRPAGGPAPCPALRGAPAGGRKNTGRWLGRPAEPELAGHAGRD